jgi:uncharacterized membrane protein YtjA (UPF0391 family)
MLHWAMALLVVALGAAIVGFGGIWVSAAPIAKTVCLVAVSLLLASAVAQLLRPRA